MRKASNKEKYLYKIMPVFRKNGFSQIKIDDIAKYMAISKATLYKHFSSKDDIVEAIVDMYADYIKEGNDVVMNEELSAIERFQKCFEHSLMCAIYISDVFLKELQTLYPSQLEKIMLAQQDRAKSLKNFFETGGAHGLFNEINPIIFMAEDDIVLRRLLDPVFSIQYEITVKKAIFDYYVMKKLQLIKAKYLEEVDDAVMDAKISYMIQKIS
ncbi:TetR/AcrR family transcriptional regulator [Ectobacillus panaciterrae]|uniref:TetR/AcrR family transcriptional regulator n=1 Tax=Ectobacillus panaciterrae TaxID=363872 RepID=UPI00041AD19B|nr:TetR/AcrR family transcriptional regulator [Ectobacillus panaciterrae]